MADKVGGIMADKPKQTETTEDLEETLETGEETAFQRWKRRILKAFGLLFVLALIVVAGFFAGVYLRVLDVYEVNEKIDLYAIPFIGEYFVEPAKKTPGLLDEYVVQPIIGAKDWIAAKMSEEPKPEATPEGQSADGDKKPDEKKDDKKDDKNQPKPIKKEEESKPVVLTKEEIEKRQKEEEAAERKRVSKLAKLYNEMKPEAAADIMTDLDDEIAVAVLQKMDESQAAKVLAALDPGQSARLTRSIYTGRRSSMTSPGDQMTPSPQVAEE